uniref:Uncharacterized protein n=1 Tax=Cacopsylla melanoneura TaxID=428564 RepID=A0A8D9BVB4_9HEMI
MSTTRGRVCNIQTKIFKHKSIQTIHRQKHSPEYFGITNERKRNVSQREKSEKLNSHLIFGPNCRTLGPGQIDRSRIRNTRNLYRNNNIMRNLMADDNIVRELMI